MRYLREAMVFGVAVAFTGLACFAGPRLAEAGGMGVGMMGRGMMGSPGSPEEASSGQVNPTHAKALLSYIHEHNPACLQCHSISGAGFGPSFESIAANYSSRANAETCSPCTLHTVLAACRRGLPTMPRQHSLPG